MRGTENGAASRAGQRGHAAHTVRPPLPAWRAEQNEQNRSRSPAPAPRRRRPSPPRAPAAATLGDALSGRAYRTLQEMNEGRSMVPRDLRGEGEAERRRRINCGACEKLGTEMPRLDGLPTHRFSQWSCTDKPQPLVSFLPSPPVFPTPRDTTHTIAYSPMTTRPTALQQPPRPRACRRCSAFEQPSAAAVAPRRTRPGEEWRSPENTPSGARRPTSGRPVWRAASWCGGRWRGVVAWRRGVVVHVTAVTAA